MFARTRTKRLRQPGPTDHQVLQGARRQRGRQALHRARRRRLRRRQPADSGLPQAQEEQDAGPRGRVPQWQPTLAVARKIQPGRRRRLARRGEDGVGEGVPDAEQDGVHGDADGAGHVEQLHQRQPQHCRGHLSRGETVAAVPTREDGERAAAGVVREAGKAGKGGISEESGGAAPVGEGKTALVVYSSGK